MEHFEFKVEADQVDRRIDRFLRDHLEGVSRSRIQKLIVDGMITVNGEEIRANYRLREDDLIEGDNPQRRRFHLVPEQIELDIRYEDDYLLVINKPPGLVVHPAVGNYTGTLLNGIIYYLGQKAEDDHNLHPGLVHRLDKDTSGLLLVSKVESVRNFLQEELKARRIKRHYQAIVWGHLRETEGKIELPLGRSPGDRRKMAVVDHNGREAVTNYHRLVRYKFADQIEVALQTGRTHQIRVHFSHIGHPVVGDRDYGGDENIISGMYDQYRQEARNILKLISRQCLHAWKLSFKHPVTKLVHTLKSDPPEDMQKIIEYLERIEHLG